MTDFYAQLERQLLAAGRRRAAGGRWGRWTSGPAGLHPRLLALAGVAIVLVGIVAAAVFAPGLRSGSPHPGAAAGASPASTTAVLPASSRAPRDITVAVLNGTTRTGLARAMADRVQRQGFTIQTIGSWVDQTVARTVVLYGGGERVRTQALRVARLLGDGRVGLTDSRAEAAAMGADIIAIAGDDQPVP